MFSCPVLHLSFDLDCLLPQTMISGDPPSLHVVCMYLGTAGIEQPLAVLGQSPTVKLNFIAAGDIYYFSPHNPDFLQGYEIAILELQHAGVIVGGRTGSATLAAILRTPGPKHIVCQRYYDS